METTSGTAIRKELLFKTIYIFLFSGYNDMKTELKDFLQRFAAEGKVIKTCKFISIHTI